MLLGAKAALLQWNMNGTENHHDTIDRHYVKWDSYRNKTNRIYIYIYMHASLEKEIHLASTILESRKSPNLSYRAQKVGGVTFRSKV